MLINKIKLYLEVIRFNRPAGWLVLIWPTLSALWIANLGFPGWHLLIVFVFGTILMRSAGCTINDVADKDFDNKVKRTLNRPLTSGKISVKETLLLGFILTLISFFLILTTRIEAVIWSIPAVIFTIIYPFTKRFFSVPQMFLGIAFSFGILIAFAASIGFINNTSLLLWLANLFLVLAYDTEYAMVDKDDDLKIGIKTSAITFGKFDVLIILISYFLCLFIIYLALIKLNLNYFFYLGLFIALIQIICHYFLIKNRQREKCFTAFSKSHYISMTLFLGIALSLI